MTSAERDTLIKSYRYIRAAMVGVLLCLGVAVAYQSWRQDRTILSSISAYYYTPAQAIFVGSLVALGVCMIALQGTTTTEDVLLNIGGMLAPVVALVPTSRGADHRRAVEACNASDGFAVGYDCRSVDALEAAAQANIANNMVALLCVGFAGLVAAYLFPGTGWNRRSRAYRIGFLVAFGLWVVGLFTLFAARQGFIHNAHWISAIGLFICIVAVAIANALRRWNRKPPVEAGLIKPYAVIAGLMVLVGLLGGVLVYSDVLSLFWLEAALITLFAVFWIAQTRERWNENRPPEPIHTPETIDDGLPQGPSSQQRLESR